MNEELDVSLTTVHPFVSLDDYDNDENTSREKCCTRVPLENINRIAKSMFRISIQRDSTAHEHQPKDSPEVALTTLSLSLSLRIKREIKMMMMMMMYGIDWQHPKAAACTL